MLMKDISLNISSKQGVFNNTLEGQVSLPIDVKLRGEWSIPLISTTPNKKEIFCALNPAKFLKESYIANGWSSLRLWKRLW